MRRRTASVAIVVLSMFAAACAGSTSSDGATSTQTSPLDATSSSVATPTPAPAATKPAEPTTPAVADDDPASNQASLLDQELVTAVVNKVLVSEGTALAVVIARNGDSVEASNGLDDNGQAPTAAATFRVGSITKVFTSLATLTLVDDGVIDLEAPAAQYVTRVPVPAGVTVRDLLQHTSGIYDIGGLDPLLEAPDRVWTPEEILEIWIQSSAAEPGSPFRYSSSNYYILGVLIEEVTGQPYATVIRERIISPLGLLDTFVAGQEDGPAPFDPYLPRGEDSYDYTSFATATWSAGAIVSSAPDLHTLFTALFEQRIVSADILAMMTANSEYSLGVRLWDQGLVGHDGFTPGYHTLVVHSPETGVTAFFASTDDLANPTAAFRTLIDGLTTSTTATPD